MHSLLPTLWHCAEFSGLSSIQKKSSFCSFGNLEEGNLKRKSSFIKHILCQQILRRAKLKAISIFNWQQKRPLSLNMQYKSIVLNEIVHEMKVNCSLEQIVSQGERAWTLDSCTTPFPLNNYEYCKLLLSLKSKKAHSHPERKRFRAVRKKIKSRITLFENYSNCRI